MKTIDIGSHNVYRLDGGDAALSIYFRCQKCGMKYEHFYQGINDTYEDVVEFYKKNICVSKEVSEQQPRGREIR